MMDSLLEAGVLAEILEPISQSEVSWHLGKLTLNICLSLIYFLLFTFKAIIPDGWAIICQNIMNSSSNFDY